MPHVGKIIPTIFGRKVERLITIVGIVIAPRLIRVKYSGENRVSLLAIIVFLLAILQAELLLSRYFYVLLPMGETAPNTVLVEYLHGE